MTPRPPHDWPRRSAAAGLLAGLMVLAACTSADGKPSTETQQTAERPDTQAPDEQGTVTEREPTVEGAQPPAGQPQEPEPGAGRAQQPAEPAGQEPTAAEGTLPPGGTPQQQQDQTTADGVIAVTGTDIDSRPVLQTANGALGVTGDLTAELRRLSGARVRVEGERRSGRLPGESIDVSSYTVLEVNGERPEVGTIMLRDGATWLAGADTIRLIGASDRLTALDAAKVWVTGRRTEDGLEVGAYGLIRR